MGMERSVLVKRLSQPDEPWRYWATRPMAERLAMVEQLRCEHHAIPTRPTGARSGSATNVHARGQQTSSSMPSGSRKNSDKMSPSGWISPTSCAPAPRMRAFTISSVARSSTWTA